MEKETIIKLSELENQVLNKLNNTNDLLDVMWIGSELENTMDSAEYHDGFYNNFHFKKVPEWINKHWGNGMKFNGGDIFDWLYGKYIHDKFKKYLSDKGMNSQECFVSIMAGNMHDNKDTYRVEFYMGFDIFGDDEHKSGYAVFQFKEEFNDIKDSKTLRDLNPHDGTSSCYINTDGKTFYNSKSPHGYNLHEDLSDGGYALRLD